MNKKLILSYKFLEEAWESLKKYKENKDELYLRQACEKGWGAVMSSLKKINPKIRRHSDFSKTAAKLAKEYNNLEIIKGESCGEALHSIGFYEGAIKEEAVELNLRCIEEFLGVMNNILNSKKE